MWYTGVTMKNHTEKRGPERVFCSAAEAAEMLGVSAPTVHKLIRTGELEAFLPFSGARKRLLYTYQVHLYARKQRRQSDARIIERIRELEAAIRAAS